MLHRNLNEYLALRRATGFKFADGESQLRKFVKFAKARGDRSIRSETVIAWASQAGTRVRRHRRMRMVTRFAEFLRAEDPQHELPPQNLFYAHSVRPSPHIYSEQDISRIVAYAAQLGPNGSLRPLAFSTLFGLMAVTGLRISETLNLRFKDITPDGLVVRETKFRKSRIVPVHETTTAVLQAYVVARRKIPGQSDHVFISRQQRPFSNGTVLFTFHEVCARAGIGRTLSGTLPRVHDLRHTFCVRALERCPVGRDRVEKHMVALTTYLGHARIESTYWYLERTPRLLRDIAAACEAIAPGGAP